MTTEAVAVRQPQVEQDEVDFRRNLRDRGGGRRGLADRVSVVPKPLAQRPADQILVVNDENVCGAH